jgi:FMN phosphatase YigB (HAD superfamily)/DNA-binding Xre family transcriptional regulator
MDEVGLGKVLQTARKKAGLTQQELCHRAKLSYSTLAKIERGAIKAPSIFTIQNIAAALGVSMGELIGEASVKSEPKKRSRSGVRFVYFDVNGCLVRFFHQAFTRLAHESGVPTDAIESTYWHYNDEVCRGELPLEELDKILAKRLGMPKLHWSDYYLDSVDPIPEMRELVTWASENYHVGLLTNIMPGFIDAMIKRDLIPRLPYAAIIDSSEVHVIKPQPEIYKLAGKKAGVEPHEILLVDDDRANLMAAERMGWHVLWFDDYRPAESVEHVRSALEPAQ